MIDEGQIVILPSLAMLPVLSLLDINTINMEK